MNFRFIGKRENSLHFTRLTSAFSINNIVHCFFLPEVKMRAIEVNYEKSLIYLLQCGRDVCARRRFKVHCFFNDRCL